MTATYPVNSDYCANCNTIGDHRTAQCTSHTTRDEAIQRVIIDPIEASGEVANAWAEFDIDAIADEVLGDYSEGYRLRVDVGTFWRTVKRHARNDFPGGAL